MYELSSNNISFKLPGKKDRKKWIEDVCNFAAGNMSVHNSDYVRTRVRDMKLNYNLYDGIIHAEDFVHMVNPLDLATIDTTRELHHYPIAAPIIDLLVGEEIDRPYEPVIGIINNKGLASKEQRKREWVNMKIQSLEQTFEGSDQELAKEVNKISRILKFTYKDVKEMKASALYRHYATELRINESFVEGYRGVWLSAEEAYAVDIVNGDVTFEVLDPTKLRYWGRKNTQRIEDSDMISYESHLSPGTLIDMYGDELKKDDVDRILEGNVNSDSTYDSGLVVDGQFIPYLGVETEYGTGITDYEGNIRHLRIRWKAYVKFNKIKYQDAATGEELIKVRPQEYKLQNGEISVGHTWSYQWWICTLIGVDIIVDAKPQPIFQRTAPGISEGHPGIVGEIYNLNNRIAVPAMTKMRAQQYMYDVIMDNIIIAMSKNIGPILDMDMSRKPEKWDVKKWLSYIYKYNLKFRDNFREIKKGAAKGQIAGNMQTGRDEVQQLDFGNYIQQLVNLAEFMKSSMSESIGVTPQRLGAVGTRETVGGVERATSQSSHITEWFSYKHENVKNRAGDLLINAAVRALEDNPKKLSVIVDAKIERYLSIMEDDFENLELGIRVTDSRKAHEYKNILEQTAHAYMQNGGDFAFVFDVLFSESMSEKRRLIEQMEQDKREQAQEESRVQQEQFQQELAKQEAKDQQLIELDKYKADLKARVDLKVKEIDAMVKLKDVEQKNDKTIADLRKEIAKLAAYMDTEQQKLELDKQGMKIKEREVRAKERVNS
jgi:hypothetical protein